MMNGQYKIGDVVFQNWTIQKLLGEGSFGKVYEVVRSDFGETYSAALKIITVPTSDAELKSVLAEGMSREEAKEYFYSMVQDIVKEFALMSKVKGLSNFVSYEDHEVLPHDDGIGWDILIRMEELTPLLDYVYKYPFSRRDVIRLGVDLSRALETCQKYNIIHRDIKPENIFVSPNGDFKLGDFGIARTIDRNVSGLSKKGTYSYMAPEVYRGDDYGFSVDIYSLGIVLYRMLNRNRVPFLPLPPTPVRHKEREQALVRRMKGEPFSMPCYAQDRLGEIVLKASAYDPKDRYASPGQMRQELEAILYTEKEGEAIYPEGDERNLKKDDYISQSDEKEEKTEHLGKGKPSETGKNDGSDNPPPETPEEEPPSDPNPSRFGGRKMIIAGAGAAALVLVAIIAAVFIGKGFSKPKTDGTTQTESEKQTSQSQEETETSTHVQPTTSGPSEDSESQAGLDPAEEAACREMLEKAGETFFENLYLPSPSGKDVRLREDHHEKLGKFADDLKAFGFWFGAMESTVGGVVPSAAYGFSKDAVYFPITMAETGEYYGEMFNAFSFFDGTYWNFAYDPQDSSKYSPDMGRCEMTVGEGEHYFTYTTGVTDPTNGELLNRLLAYRVAPYFNGSVELGAAREDVFQALGLDDKALAWLRNGNLQECQWTDAYGRQYKDRMNQSWTAEDGTIHGAGYIGVPDSNGREMEDLSIIDGREGCRLDIWFAHVNDQWFLTQITFADMNYYLE